MLTRYEKLIAIEAAIKSEQIIAMSEEVGGFHGPVYDKQGVPMTPEQITKRVRSSWTNDLLEKGWNLEKVKEMKLFVDREVGGILRKL